MVLSKGGRIIAVAAVYCAAIKVTLRAQLGSGKAIVHQGSWGRDSGWLDLEVVSLAGELGR